jgi:signal transduction histidine kinase
MVSDIRRLVYQLYPSVLDEFGLVEALRLHLAQMSGLHNGGVQLCIEASPDPLPELSAASEVAAYRIVLEGVTNVVRHSGATRCSVALAAQKHRLPKRITDKGRGVPTGDHPGNGLASMQERAEELGGALQIESADGGGTQITAELPYKGRR